MSVRLPVIRNEVIPVARPASAYSLPTPLAKEAETSPDATWLSRQNPRSWAFSLVLHGILLLIMGLWYFSPKVNSARAFDTRLGGSELGVDEGLTFTGGLNTELDLSAVLNPPPEPSNPTSLLDNLSNLIPKVAEPPGAAVASARGGVDNPNPGAGGGDGFGLARFGQGGENIQGVEVKVGDPQFTLLWDTEVDLDLHVIEPGGKEIYWEEPRGKRGGELDVDNTKGFGPENIFWLREDDRTGRKVQISGPPGEYRWFVVYWGGFGGIPRPTRWKVRVKHAGKVSVYRGKFSALNDRSKTYTLRVDTPSDGTAEPVTTR
ncbi:MAG: hypothetical protein NVSMB9_33530 [Isosphaeraceae bacterium]